MSSELPNLPRNFLKRAGLPKDYPSLSPRNRTKARMSSLTSWFDITQPHVLCTDTERFVQAAFLWAEYYIKPADCNRGVYYFRDPLDKYDMLSLMMAPSLVPGKPAKGIITATRRKSKTKTCIHEAFTLITAVRPFSTLLLSELNDTRTKEELKEIKFQFENNDRIHSDFGAEGVLFPRRTTGTWSTSHLTLLHLPRSEIIGASLKSAQRGRGPILGVVDDPEDEENTYSREWRVAFFSKLFNTYVPMFTYGGKILWIGTPIHGASCLSLAMHGRAETEQYVEASLEKRFREWRKTNFSNFRKDGKGNWVSMQPDRMTVKTFLHLLETDPISTRAEILCQPTTPGSRAFKVDTELHGFMHCQGDPDYFLDLHTGEQKPWTDFLADLEVVGAGDYACGQSEDADPGALIWIGTSSSNTIYVLDAYIQICFVDRLVDMAYALSGLYDTERFGWEHVGLQVAINQAVVQATVDRLREEGRAPPTFLGIDNAKKNKIRRILSMIPLFGNHQVRLRHLEPFKDSDGVVHTPVPFARAEMYAMLLGQIQEYTDNGIRGHDDAIDALEMAVRLVRQNVRDPLVVDATPTDGIIRKWQEHGMTITPASLPEEAWTDKMLREAERPSIPGTVVPYV